jgi:glycerol-3-phosphate acyltransferase PlsY
MINAPAVFGLILMLAYLLGSIPFSWVVCRWKGVDISRVGSGNYGATNVFRALGVKPALLVFFFDAAKGAAAIWISTQLFESQVIHIIIGFTAIFGHSFSLFLGFRGGKGVATAAGVFLLLTPLPLTLTATAVLIVIFITKIVSVGTLVACGLYPSLLIAFNYPKGLVYVVGGMALFIVFRHRSNIDRLIKGTENKIK